MIEAMAIYGNLWPIRQVRRSHQADDPFAMALKQWGM
jgi:hypothetical protein